MPRRPGAPRRTLEQIDRDAKCLALYCQGFSYAEIGKKLGISTSTAHSGVKKAIKERQDEAFDQPAEFTAAVARIQAGIRKCQEIIDTPHFLAGKDGKIITRFDPETGEDVPVLDAGPKQRAITEQRHLNDQLITLLDLKPAAKSRVEVVTEDVVDREIKKLNEEIAALTRTQTPTVGS